MYKQYKNVRNTQQIRLDWNGRINSELSWRKKNTGNRKDAGDETYCSFSTTYLGNIATCLLAPEK